MTMAKKGRFEAARVQRKKSHAFAIGMTVYTVLFLVLTAFGWKVLWDFMESYEHSRPKNTVSAYMSSLQGDFLYNLAGESLSKVDREIQSEEECREIFLNAVDGKLHSVKDPDNSSDTRQRYVVLAEKQPIGSFIIQSGQPDRFGNTPWSVTESAFDFSFLMGEPVTVTVPSDFTVLANGKELADSYIARSDIPYEVYGDFYNEFDLPTMKEYKVENYLGEIQMSAWDASGAEAALESNQSWASQLDNCSEDTQRKLINFLTEFIARYVSFSGSSKDTASGTFAEFRRYLLPDSPMIQRFASAIDGLQYGQSVQDKVADIHVHLVSQIDDDHWFIDATYLVDTMGKKGLVQTTNNLKVVITTQNGFYYVAGMTSY